MSNRGFRIANGTLFALGICTILACDDYDEFREDVVLCEEAVAHLEDCCGSRAPVLRCSYFYDHRSGCESRSERPDLSVGESKSILAQSCPSLCARLEEEAR